MPSSHLARACRALGGADREGRRVPLRNFLSPSGGWDVTSKGRSAQVEPASAGTAHPAYTQLTAGVTVNGLIDVLQAADAHMFTAAAPLRPLFATGKRSATRSRHTSRPRWPPGTY
jgi:hypothetical protein